jgi:hypothetical protein
MGYLKSFVKNKQEERLKKGGVSALDSILKYLKEQFSALENGIQLMQRKYNTNETPLILNSLLFFRLTFIDIIGLVKQLQLADNDLNKNLIARNLAVHLYEFLDDTPDFTGKEMKKNLIGLPVRNH